MRSCTLLIFKFGLMLSVQVLQLVAAICGCEAVWVTNQECTMSHKHGLHVSEADMFFDLRQWISVTVSVASQQAKKCCFSAVAVSI